MSEMMALRAHIRGGADGLQYERAPRPELEPGDVLVKVNAAGITFAELDWEETWLRQGMDRTPIIPAHEVSGVVVDVGDSADFVPGSTVFGLVPFDRDGAAAEYVAVPATCMAFRPAAISDVIGAGAPLAALTAWQALTTHARCTAGDQVLIHGAAGSVGGLATQLAKTLGAHVTGTARARDRDVVLGLGADRVIAFDTEIFDSETARYDIVIDTVGGDTLARSYPVVRPGGHLVTLQAPPSSEMAEQYGISATFFIVTADRHQLADIAAMIRDGRLRITIAATYPLAKGRQAYLSGAERQRRPGKTVLTIDQ